MLRASAAAGASGAAGAPAGGEAEANASKAVRKGVGAWGVEAIEAAEGAEGAEGAVGKAMAGGAGGARLALTATSSVGKPSQVRLGMGRDLTSADTTSAGPIPANHVRAGSVSFWQKTRNERPGGGRRPVVHFWNSVPSGVTAVVSSEWVGVVGECVVGE